MVLAMWTFTMSGQTTGLIFQSLCIKYQNMIIRLRPDPHLPGLGVLLEGGAEQGVYVGGVAASAQPGLVPGHQETPDTGDWDTELYTLHITH